VRDGSVLTPALRQAPIEAALDEAAARAQSAFLGPEGLIASAENLAAARATAAERERWLGMLREPSEAMVEAMRHADLHGDGLLYPRLFHALADYIEAEARPTAGEEKGDG